MCNSSALDKSIYDTNFIGSSCTFPDELFEAICVRESIHVREERAGEGGREDGGPGSPFESRSGDLTVWD